MKLYTTYSRLLGVVITGCRKSKKITQRDMSECLGIGQPAFSRLETASNSMSVEALALIALIFDCRPSEILAAVEHLADLLEEDGVRVLCDDFVCIDAECMLLSRQQLEERILKIVNA